MKKYYPVILTPTGFENLRMVRTRYNREIDFEPINERRGIPMTFYTREFALNMGIRVAKNLGYKSPVRVFHTEMS